MIAMKLELQALGLNSPIFSTMSIFGQRWVPCKIWLEVGVGGTVKFLSLAETILCPLSSRWHALSRSMGRHPCDL